MLEINKTFKISTWNINSVRARIELLIEWIKNTNPDVILLQETKCLNDQFPYEQLSEFNYNIIVNGQKSYNGVAILSKYPLEEIKIDFPSNHFQEDKRFIESICKTPLGIIRLISIYVPNGQIVGSEKYQKKLEFFDSLLQYLISIKRYDEYLFIGGDFNAAPFDIDVYSRQALENSIGFTVEERKKIRAIINNGFVDTYRICNPNIQEFSWWDYRARGFENNLGMRIDFLLSTSNASSKLVKCTIDKYMRAKEKPSDHVPITAEFSIS